MGLHIKAQMFADSLSSFGPLKSLIGYAFGFWESPESHFKTMDITFGSDLE